MARGHTATAKSRSHEAKLPLTAEVQAPSNAGSDRWQPTPNANAMHPSHPFPTLTAYSERGGCAPNTARVDGCEGERSSSATDQSAGRVNRQGQSAHQSASHRATSRPDAALGRLGRQSRERRVRLLGQRRSETPSVHDVITRDTVQGGARARTGSERACDVSAPYDGRGGFPEKRSSRGGLLPPVRRSAEHLW